MGVSVPSDYDLDITSIAPVTFGNTLSVSVSGIPSSYQIDTNNIAKIQLTADPLEIRPLDLSVRLKEIPSIRGHLPADFCVGLAFLGIELIKLRLCGEAQIITEPFRPNPCEVCGQPARTVDRPAQVGITLTNEEG
jgi:hypothetical protein